MPRATHEWLLGGWLHHKNYYFYDYYYYYYYYYYYFYYDDDGDDAEEEKGLDEGNEELVGIGMTPSTQCIKLDACINRILPHTNSHKRTPF